ncbi:coiled-coil domain-containing protein 9B isoform X2 [Hoplias malabaricus]|uniref:coiled-coil domain-containing protein 9B isoform X2 n=1 Tax=Hoplias malabaricus TaxID=27720 RepID=UPI003462FC43
MMAYYIPGTVQTPWTFVSSGLWEDGEPIDTDVNFNLASCLYNLDICEQSPTDMMLLKKEQKDAELDKKIEALRKKNEALMKRYQEVEEDKKRAEQEGMALQSRKGKVEDLTITINKSPTEKRVVTKKGSGSMSPKGLQEQEEGGPSIFSSGRGKRRQLLVTTPGNAKGKRVVSERVDRKSSTGPLGTKHPSEDIEEQLDTTAGARNCLNTRRATGNQVGRKQERKSRADEAYGFTEYDPYSQLTEVLDIPHHTVLDTPASSEEQQEYLRWKKEREEIDRERVARHKNSQGQWRRAWDMDKPELMFSEKGAAERGTQNRGGRNGRRGHLRSSPAESSRGDPVRQRDKRGKNVPVVGSKAKGKDRLTGRARRWDAKMEGEDVQASPDTSLEEFLEELDSLCEPQAESNTPELDSNDGFRMHSSSEIKVEGQQHQTESANTEAANSKNTEKKVRFSEELIQGAYEKNSNTGSNETKASSLKNTSQAKTAAGEEEGHQASEHYQDAIRNTHEQESTDLLPIDIHSKPLESEEVQETGGRDLPESPEHSIREEVESEAREAPGYSLSSQNSSNASDFSAHHPLEHMKSSTARSTEELIDSSLSVLTLESGDPLPDHNTSTDKARENGKVV